MVNKNRMDHRGGRFFREERYCSLAWYLRNALNSLLCFEPAKKGSDSEKRATCGCYHFVLFLPVQLRHADAKSEKLQSGRGLFLTNTKLFALRYSVPLSNFEACSVK